MVQTPKVGCHLVDNFLPQVILKAGAKVHKLLTLTQSLHGLADICIIFGQWNKPNSCQIDGASLVDTACPGSTYSTNKSFAFY